jgi:hypothetical protein
MNVVLTIGLCWVAVATVAGRFVRRRADRMWVGAGDGHPGHAVGDDGDAD